MDVREKLVELLRNAKAAMKSENLSCDIARNMFVVDFMMSNGVTVQKWISVKDRLPECCVSVLARCFYNGKWRTLVCHTSKEHAGEWYTDEVCQWVKVTHWMPLPPELLKGE